MIALIACLSMLRAETHVYKKSGALEIRAEVYRKAEGTRLPVIFFIHGGALIMGSRKGLAESRPGQLAQYLDAGFVVVSIRDSNTVEVFIARLRRKLGAPFIETVRGLGYRMLEPC